MHESNGIQEQRIERMKSLFDAAFDDAARAPALIADMFVAFLRGFWKLYLAPPSSAEEADSRLIDSIVPMTQSVGGTEYTTADWRAYLESEWGEPTFDAEVLTQMRNAPSFRDWMAAHMATAKDIPTEPDDDEEDRMFRSVLDRVWREWEPRVIHLSPPLVASMRDINREYLEWLQKHPDVIDRISWEAFERLVAEIFSSKGFSIELTGRVRDRSSDILGVRVDEFACVNRSGMIL